jgi:nickel transport protein
MMRRYGAALSLVVLFLSAASVCMAHGVDGYAEQAAGYCVTAQYSDGEPMSWSEVRIAAPDSDIEFQNGRTDRNGRFMFLPDGDGTWAVVVQDGMGHRLALDVTVAGDGVSVQKQARDISDAAHGKTGRKANIAAGLAIIFGLCGLFYGWKSGRKRQR